MVSRNEAKRQIAEIVERYGLLEKNQRLLKGRQLSEQDISTKFVLPMIYALNWDPYSITPNGPEIHEKGFREKRVEGGLPDFSLKGKYSKIPFFVEVKHPRVGINPKRDLKKYDNGHIVWLTSFKESLLVVIGNHKRKDVYPYFKAKSWKLYVNCFEDLWKYLSDTKHAERARAGIKSWRNRAKRILSEKASL